MPGIEELLKQMQAQGIAMPGQDQGVMPTGGPKPTMMGPATTTTASGKDPMAPLQDWAKGYAQRFMSGEEIKKPDIKFSWREVIGAMLNPNVMPYLWQKKLAPIRAEEDASQERGEWARSILGGMMRKPSEREPQRPLAISDSTRGVYSPDSGEYKEIPGGGKRTPFVHGNMQWDESTGAFTPITGYDPSGPSAESSDALPAGMAGRLFDRNVNPYPAGDIRNKLTQMGINAGPARSMEAVQREARRAYQGARQAALEFGRPDAEAEAQAQAAYDAYMRQFGGVAPTPGATPPGAPQPKPQSKTLEQRYAEKMAAGMTHKQAVDAIADEDVDNPPDGS